jgi:hypothetical protein
MNVQKEFKYWDNTIEEEDWGYNSKEEILLMGFEMINMRQKVSMQYKGKYRRNKKAI